MLLSRTHERPTPGKPYDAGKPFGRGEVPRGQGRVNAEKPGAFTH